MDNETEIQYEEAALIPAIDDRIINHKKCGSHLVPIIGNLYFCEECQCQVELRVK